MPSPSIPRSKSTPDISGAPHSPSHSDSDVLSRLTSWSENSPRTWPKKVGAFLARKTSTSKKPTLTAERLKEFDRLNEILEEEIRRNNFQSSPYYRGLTDSTLAINRRRPSSPNPDAERESHTGTLFSTSTKTSLVYKMQGWGTSCFLSNSKEKEERISSSSSKRSQDFLTPTVSSLSSPSRKANRMRATRENAAKVAKELDSDRKNVPLNTEKPLRERILHPSSLPMPVSKERPKTAPADPPKTVNQEDLQAGKADPEAAQYQAEERRYIWADKYRPYDLKDFLCNRNKALELQARAKSECRGHFIFEGQPGVGKKTMIWAFLREAFGGDNVEAREESKKFILKGEAIGSINVKIQQSSKHVEINISELRGYEKHVIVELIKEKSDNGSQGNPDNCRAIILYDADKLPTEALLYIKWVLERYITSNKLFFCCSDASKIKPLSSICTLVQLLPPSNEEIIEVLEFIAEKQGIGLPKELAAKIAKSSKNNLRQAIRSFEATWHFNSALKADQEIMNGWEYDIANIARNVIEEQSPKQLYIIRGKLQNLIEHNVSAEFIFEILVKELKKNLNEQLQKQIDTLYVKYTKNDDSKKLFAPQHQQEVMVKMPDDPVKKAVQHFLKIEEFIAKFMSRYKCLVAKDKEIRTEASGNTTE